MSPEETGSLALLLVYGAVAFMFAYVCWVAYRAERRAQAQKEKEKAIPEEDLTLRSMKEDLTSEQFGFLHSSEVALAYRQHKRVLRATQRRMLLQQSGPKDYIMVWLRWWINPVTHVQEPVLISAVKVVNVPEDRSTSPGLSTTRYQYWDILTPVRYDYESPAASCKEALWFTDVNGYIQVPDRYVQPLTYAVQDLIITEVDNPKENTEYAVMVSGTGQVIDSWAVDSIRGLRSAYPTTEADYVSRHPVSYSRRSGELKPVFISHSLHPDHLLVTEDSFRNTLIGK